MLSNVTKIEPWLSQSFDCACGGRHEVPIRAVHIEAGALKLLPGYCTAQGITRAAVVADARTLEVAGAEVRRLLDAAGVDARVIVLPDTREGEVVADEAAIVALLVQLPADTETVVAVGSGSIHDIVRFACHAGRRRFLSVPTAPSVDGFASVGAPLVIGGFKNTVSAMSPEAIFADLDVLSKAPQAMIAAGFGDMLGKYTSLADWRMGRLLAGEHYCELCADMTEWALEACIGTLPDIAAAKPEGIRILTEALILSGISMLLIGHSRPASGAEHHLSHFWEMRYLQEGRKALLHGAKVGAATVIIAGLYAELALLLRTGGAAALAAQLRSDPEQDRRRIEQAFGSIAGQVLAENAPLKEEELAALKERLVRQEEELLKVAESVPLPEQMAEWLAAAGGLTTPGQLGVSPELVEQSLASAYYIRSRLTVLRFLHMAGAMD
jgi:glycerol-1-phosphate dehydrogenase [NAD(P)+]